MSEKPAQFVPESIPRGNGRKGTREGRLKEIIRDLASRFIEKESNRISLITVTSVNISESGKEATIYFTVLPIDKEVGVLDFLKRKRSEFRGYVMNESRLPRVPFFDFEIDAGEKNRQKIDEISRRV